MSHGIWTPENFGWIAVPRNRSNVPSAKDVKEMNNEFYSDPMDAWPVTDVTDKARDYAAQHLSKETFNHSMRVFCYGKYPSTPTLPSATMMETTIISSALLTPYNRYLHHPTLLPRIPFKCLFRNLGTDLPIPRHRHDR